MTFFHRGKKNHRFLMFSILRFTDGMIYKLLYESLDTQPPVLSRFLDKLEELWHN